MAIRYNRVLAGLMVILGGLNVVLGGWLILLGQFSFSFILGLMFLFIGVMYWQRPYFSVQKDYVVVPALIGPVKREFSIRSPQDVKLEDGKILVQSDGTWKRIPVYRWMSHPDDWREMLKFVQSMAA